MTVVITIFAPLIGFHGKIIVKQTTDQVNTGLRHSKTNTLRLIQCLYTPAHIVHNTGIGVNVALEAHLST